MRASTTVPSSLFRRARFAVITTCASVMVSATAMAAPTQSQIFDSEVENVAAAYPCIDGTSTVVITPPGEDMQSFPLLVIPCVGHLGLLASDDPGYTPDAQLTCRISGGSNTTTEAQLASTTTKTSTTTTEKKKVNGKEGVASVGNLGVDPNFVQPCQTRVVCANGSAKCDASERVTLINAYPSVDGVEDTAEGAGIIHNRVLGVMKAHMDDILARGGTPDAKTLESLYRWTATEFAIGKDHSAVGTLPSKDDVVDMVNDTKLSFLDATCAASKIGGEPGEGCTFEFIDLLKKFHGQLLNSSSLTEFDALLAELELRAEKELSGAEREFLLGYVSTARGSSNFWGNLGNSGSQTKAWKPPKWLVSDAVGFLTGVLTGGGINVVSGGVTGAIFSLTTYIEDNYP